MNKDIVDIKNIYNKLYIDDTRAAQDLSSDVNVDILLHRMNYLQEILNAKEYDLVLLYGTLLGFMRDNGFITGDNDVDVGIVLKESNIKEIKRLFKYLETKNCFITKSYDNDGQYHLKIIDRVVDLWLIWLKNDELFISNSIFGEFNKSVLLPLKEIGIKDYQFKIPNNYQKLFQYWYGDWKIKSDIRPIMKDNHYFNLEKKENE